MGGGAQEGPRAGLQCTPLTQEWNTPVPLQAPGLDQSLQLRHLGNLVTPLWAEVLGSVPGQCPEGIPLAVPTERCLSDGLPPEEPTADRLRAAPLRVSQWVSEHVDGGLKSSGYTLPNIWKARQPCIFRDLSERLTWGERRVGSRQVLEGRGCRGTFSDYDKLECPGASAWLLGLER